MADGTQFLSLLNAEQKGLCTLWNGDWTNKLGSRNPLVANCSTADGARSRFKLSRQQNLNLPASDAEKVEYLKKNCLFKSEPFSIKNKESDKALCALWNGHWTDRNPVVHNCDDGDGLRRQLSVDQSLPSNRTLNDYIAQCIPKNQDIVITNQEQSDMCMIWDGQEWKDYLQTQRNPIVGNCSAADGLRRIFTLF
ncbi:hypothetical protein HK102_004432 [Quaeritorhiza haematococci]|nr:hypothetical protein HK102_004432 [Quaeritorhiza haematococci]